jgi:hypothetical protein
LILNRYTFPLRGCNLRRAFQKKEKLMELTEEKLRALLERAEVNPTPEDFEVLMKWMPRYFERLSKFRELDLNSEEVAGTYIPPKN